MRVNSGNSHLLKLSKKSNLENLESLPGFPPINLSTSQESQLGLKFYNHNSRNFIAWTTLSNEVVELKFKTWLETEKEEEKTTTLVSVERRKKVRFEEKKKNSKNLSIGPKMS